MVVNINKKMLEYSSNIYNIIRRNIKKYRKELPEIEIKKLKTRWGSCSPYQNKVTFNLSLIKTPIECVEYVVIHELSHFKEQNHSKKFYKIVESYI